jgi:hypothetical protein
MDWRAVTQQLTDGIRMLQMQAHNDSGVIQLCHTSCVCPQRVFLFRSWLLTFTTRFFTMAEHWPITWAKVSLFSVAPLYSISDCFIS